MIFVTLGTHERPFYRLVKEIEKLIKNKKIKERIVIQLGFTNYIVSGAECYSFLPNERFERYVKNCSILITHGGLGSIMKGLRYGKVVVAVPRLSRFGEHTDDHQLQIVKEAQKRGSVLPVYDIKLLWKTIKIARKMKGKRRKHTPKKILFLIEHKLEEWNLMFKCKKKDC